MEMLLFYFSYGVQVYPTTGINVPEIPESTKDVFRQHLTSLNDWAIAGILLCNNVLLYVNSNSNSTEQVQSQSFVF